MSVTDNEQKLVATDSPDNDPKTLERFIKNFAHKYVQVVVQSRQGEPQTTSCRPPEGDADWFLLNVPDLPDVADDVRRILRDNPFKTLRRSPLCIELSARGPCGESMVLEIWELALLPETDALRGIYESYNRMIILLKSLVAVTRVVPAFRLAQRQHADRFILHYRLYLGPMREETCGEDSGFVEIGQASTSLCKLSVSVRYRQNLNASDMDQFSDQISVLKSNYFDLIGTESHRVDGASTDNDGPAAPDSLENSAARPISPPDVPPGPIDTGRVRQLNECSPFGAFACEPSDVLNSSGSPTGPELTAEDFIARFSALLLDPDDTLPTEEEEILEEGIDDEHDENVFDEGSSSSRHSTANSADIHVKPAFAENSSDMDVFFTGPLPPLRSLQVDDQPSKLGVVDANYPRIRKSRAVDQQVKDLNKHLDVVNEIDSLLQEASGSES